MPRMAGRQLQEKERRCSLDLVQQADQEIRGGWQMNAYQSSCLSGTDNQAVVLKSDGNQ